MPEPPDPLSFIAPGCDIPPDLPLRDDLLYPWPLGPFLLENPEYHQYVFWSVEHDGWAMPGWVGNVFYAWIRRDRRPPLDQQSPEERAAREGRN